MMKQSRQIASATLYQLGLYDPSDLTAPVELLEGCHDLEFCRAVIDNYNEHTPVRNMRVVHVLGIFPATHPEVARRCTTTNVDT